MVISFTTKTPLNRHFCAALKGQNFLLLPPPKTLTMAEIKIRPAKQKRPTCPSCSKPAWLCLCARIKTKQLENSIAVTVLQHSLEKKHPLNSVRIASLGLKNVAVSTVSDVNFEAQFGVRLLESESEIVSILGSNGIEFPLIAHKVFEKCPQEQNIELIGNNSDRKCKFESNRNQFESLGSVENCGLSVSVDVKSFETKNSDKQIVEQCDEKKLSNLGDNDMTGVMTNQNMFESLGFVENCGLSSDNVKAFEAEDSDKQVVEQCNEKRLPNLYSKRGHERDVMCFSIGKQGVINSLYHIWAEPNCPAKPSFDSILKNRAARHALSKGFIVRKLQKQQREGSAELEEYMEFEIEVPRGSALLFPSEEAVSVEGLKAFGFEAKNLIVLDGTWAKAKRMYAENPWLRLVPHLKLEVGKLSLFDGVRNQPKAGCLSTIESIVYALKALGDENCEGLDGLLDVFESMVGDQRQCKEKRLRNIASPL